MTDETKAPDLFTTPRSRRDTLRVGGAFGLAAMAALVAGPAAVLAQSAAPDASMAPAAGGSLAGKYVVVRFRQFKDGVDIAEAQKIISEGFVPLNQAVPGFVSYFGSADPATGAGVYIGVFADKAGSDESNRIAAEWLQTNGYDWFEGDPTIYEGVIDYDVAAAG
jgi:hypothetical protein